MSSAATDIVGEILRRAGDAAKGGNSAGTAGTKAANSTGAAAKPKGPSASQLDEEVQQFIGRIWYSFVAVFFLYQVIFHFVRYIRTIACLNNEHQRYFATPHALHAKFKKHFLNAPLFRTRHHREFKMSSAINVGTLPSRLQTFMLVGYFATNVGFCFWNIDYKNSNYATIAGQLRNRAGILSVMNMIPLFLLAGRNNPIIKLTGLTFDTMNLIHRWIGRIVVLEAICHTIAHLAKGHVTKGWMGAIKGMVASEFLYTGLMATCAFTFLLIQSPGAIRHAFYETFLTLHIIMAAVAVAGVWIHLKKKTEAQKMMYAVVALWAMERGIRFARIAYRNFGSGGSKAEVEVLPGDALRVTVRMARPWTFRPGQHAYLYMPSIGLWSNHPFSLAWSDEEDVNMSTITSDEKGLPMNRQDILEHYKTTMSFIIRRRTGFTETLYKKADLSAAGRFTTTALVEGPYGGEDLSSYGTVMLWAAGIGITHQVPQVREIVAAYANGTTATRRVTLVWIIQSPEHLEWIRTWMTHILAMPRRREVLKILLFVTRPRSTKEIHSPSSSVQMFPGRPNVEALIDQEMQEGIGAAAVTTCGTGALADELRRAVRKRQTQWNVDFREESFSW
ncbi:ferric reductase [Byssothecium circinans]|uniref:ferric-chelate reductase (NADPH) n=1 Tax=Byssothecium circinans TaxID=147558 RepID=A0A6A5U225_9PLEO|nr:ferric reductase [Byssothecium circinans]